MNDLGFAVLCRYLLRKAPGGEEHPDLGSWTERLARLATEWPDTAHRAAVSGLHAPCVAWAFAAGYQCALDRMLGPLEANRFHALCVTERGGNRPRDIGCRLEPRGDHWVLNGEKSYVTGGTTADVLFVAARAGEDAQARPRIVMLRLQRDRAGIEVLKAADLPFVPELPHAALRFHDVKVDRNDILPGDGYARFIKPFRTLEDTYVELALTGLLIRHSRALPNAAETVPMLLGVVSTLLVAAATDATDAAAHLLLAANRSALGHAIARLEPAWEVHEPEFHAAWQRDRALLGVARGARAARTARAWEAILSGESAT